MATYTPNYNLGKPDSSDPFGNFRSLFNDNMDKIDNISGGGGGSGKILKNQTLNFVGLVATISDTDLDSDSDFAVYYYNESDAEQAGIVAESSSGMVTFTAQTTPLNTIICDIVIFSASGSGGSSTLDGLDDVNITTPTDGQILKYDSNSSKWVNVDPDHIVYSTTEKIIGKWIDGKPIYEITYEFPSALAVSYNSFTDTVIDSTDIETVINSIGIHADGTNYGALIADPTRQSHTVLGLQTNRNANNANVKILVLQYTKISD